MKEKKDSIKDEYKINKDAIVEFYKLLINKRKALTGEKSQRDVQRDIGCSNSTISRIEKIGRGIYPEDGISMLNINVFMALIKYYHLSDEEILYFIRSATGTLTQYLNLKEKLRERELEIEALKKERDLLIKNIRRETLEEVDSYVKEKIRLLSNQSSLDEEALNTETPEGEQTKKLTIN